MTLNVIRAGVKKHKNEYGEVVIAYDSKGYWRKDIFPYYKENRKSNRAKSPFNWSSIFSCMDTLKEEYKKFLPYKILDVDTVEADDIIGVLTLEQGFGDRVLIMSGDKDFIQLQSAQSSVHQYSPFTKTHIVDSAPKLTLKQHIIRGDAGDGIPNILSNDDVFVSGVRQKPIHEKKIILWLQQKPEEFCTGEMLRNFKRNESLIDLTKIPENIKHKILTVYGDTQPCTRGEFLNYLAASGLRELIGSANDF